MEMLDSVASSGVADLVDEAVIVGDGVTVDLPEGFVSQLPFRVVRAGSSVQVGANSCRQIGIEITNARYVALLDDDVLVNQQWGKSVRSLIARGIGAATGRVTSVETSALARAREVRNQSCYKRTSDGDAVGFLAGGNSLILREALILAGGFGRLPSANGFAERLASIGFPVVFEAGLVVQHVHDRGLREYVVHGWKVGRSIPLRSVVSRVHACVLPSIDAGGRVVTLNIGWSAACILGNLYSVSRRV